MRRAFLGVTAFALLWAAAVAVSPRILFAQSRLPNAKDVVSPSAYVSLAPVPRGRSFELAVVLKIRPGFHINAREASADYLIPTELRADLPAGIKAGETVYPKGTLQKFAFSKTPLNVYADRATILVPLAAESNAPLGPVKVALRLRYQACSMEVCLPPVTLDVDAAFEVAAAGAAAKSVHPEIFSPK